jgi:hypothetical protein
MANRRLSPNPPPQPSSQPLTRAEQQAVKEISEFLGTILNTQKEKNFPSHGYILNEAMNFPKVTFLNELIGPA